MCFYPGNKVARIGKSTGRSSRRRSSLDRSGADSQRWIGHNDSERGHVLWVQFHGWIDPKSVMGRCLVRCEFLIFFFWRIGKNFNLDSGGGGGEERERKDFDFIENREIFHTMEIIILEGRCNRFFHFAILLYRLMVTRSESFHQSRNEFFFERLIEFINVFSLVQSVQ